YRLVLGQGRQRELMLSLDAEELPARHDDRQVRASGENGRELRGRLDDCSKLSKRTSIRLSATWRANPVTSPRACWAIPSTSSGSRSCASWTQKTPSGKDPSTLRASSIAKPALPDPPAPVLVRRR